MDDVKNMIVRCEFPRYIMVATAYDRVADQYVPDFLNVWVKGVSTARPIFPCSAATTRRSRIAVAPARVASECRGPARRPGPEGGGSQACLINLPATILPATTSRVLRARVGRLLGFGCHAPTSEQLLQGVEGLGLGRDLDARPIRRRRPNKARNVFSQANASRWRRTADELSVSRRRLLRWSWSCHRPSRAA